jgi:hypothetical protein
MSLSFKPQRAFFAGGIVLLLIGLFFLSLWYRDIASDQKHTLYVNRATPIFSGDGNEGGCHGTQLTTVEAGTHLPVRRIRYLKDCAAIDVALPDGRRGYVVLGTGDVSVAPPLPSM